MVLCRSLRSRPPYQLCRCYYNLTQSHSPVNMMRVLCVLAVLLAVSLGRPEANQYTPCQATSQCGPGRCCVLLHGRFATTACAAYRQVGDDCRPPSDTPVNTSLSFPDGSSVAVTGVHESLCPCEQGAACLRGTCVASRSPTTLQI